MLILFTESSRALGGNAASQGDKAEVLAAHFVPPRSSSTVPLVVLTAQKVCSTQSHPLG